MKIFTVVLLSFVLVFNAIADEAPAENDAAEEYDIIEAIGLLRKNSVVLEVGDMKAQWSEVHPMFAKLLKDLGNKRVEESKAVERIRSVFQSIATRGILLQEANAMKIEVTDEDRKAFEEDLEKNLEGNDRGMTKEKFIASFAKDKSTMVRLTYEDALKLMKLDKVKFGDLTVPDVEVDMYIRYRKAMNEVINQRNAETRKLFATLKDEKGIDDDEGFMELARKYSEGRESDNGGILNYDFTREDLADINDLKEFTWNVGETTPMFETATDFRIMRMMAVVPQDDKNAPEKYRVAQILHGKIPIQQVDDREALREEMLPKKKKQAIDDYVKSLEKKYKVNSRLFPKGLWDDSPAKPAREPDVVKLDGKNAENGRKAVEQDKKTEKSEIKE